MSDRRRDPARRMPTGTTATPVVARSRGELAKALATLRRRPQTLALVPTMGALHAGHRALVRRAGELGDAVVVSIFVNPLQFGPNEDLDRYPRTFDADLQMCAAEGVALVFAPSAGVVYPEAPRVTVTAGELGTKLCGRSRPGHFDGVLTVVMKLFQLVRPDLAVFGKKDAQQLTLVRRMVSDLDVPVHIVGVTTVREPDGLAVSSRNSYLSSEERPRAVALSRALSEGLAAAPRGASAVRAAARAVFAREPGIAVDYLALVDPATLDEVPDDYTGSALLAVAAHLGSTRLIDNCTLVVGSAGSAG